MGWIFYGGSDQSLRIEDRALAHLRVVIVTKLRRSESFTLSWRHSDGEPHGRSTIWLHPAIPLKFVFDDPEPVELNRSWIADLAASAGSSGGIILDAEDLVHAVGDVATELTLPRERPTRNSEQAQHRPTVHTSTSGLQRRKELHHD